MKQSDKIYNAAKSCFNIHEDDRFYAHKECLKSVKSWCKFARIEASDKALVRQINKAYKDVCFERDSFYKSQGWI